VRIDRSLRPGLAFMTFHFPDQVETNVLTIDATDPRSGTAEFKATAIRVEKASGNGAAAAAGNGAAKANGVTGNGAGAANGAGQQVEETV